MKHGEIEERIGRRPFWLRKKTNLTERGNSTLVDVNRCGLNTVCEEARCPNLAECFGRGVATFMILGDRCTRNCRFCAVDHDVPRPVDPHEGDQIADYAEANRMSYVVITSVTRDDLDDGGAAHFLSTVGRIKRRLPRITIELLVPDFGGDPEAIRGIVGSAVDVLGHNLETTRPLYVRARSGADYDRSLELLVRARRLGRAGMKVKSGLMVGLGETERELENLFADLAAVPIDILTIGQYLRPSRDHLPVRRYYRPEEFSLLADRARAAGISVVAAGPYVRSSYQADEAYARAVNSKT